MGPALREWARRRRKPTGQGRIGIVCGRAGALFRHIRDPNEISFLSVALRQGKPYPMDGTKERDDHGSVAKLNRLDDAKEVLSSIVVKDNGIEEGIARRKLLLDVPAEVKRG
jgi:hypothetical protein